EPDLTVKFNLEGLLRGDIKSRYEAYQIGINNGFLSPNEARAKEDLNPREGGDEFMTPLNMRVGEDDPDDDSGDDTTEGAFNDDPENDD
ncbi:MAG: phage portal protein, partial [Pyramidobacter sp.]|nr:phage portal protein [Pyramidobacter sp.]